MSLLLSNNNQVCLKLRSRSGGFTLSEIALVFVIMALMIVPLYTIVLQVTKLKPDDARFEIIQEALAEHLRVTGTLPCPADPALNMDNPLAFQSVGAGCVGGGVVQVGASLVSIGSVPVDNLRAALNCGDATLLGASPDILSALKEGVYSIREVLTGEKGALRGDGNLVGTNRVEDVRCVQREYVLDEAGSKFVYAVTNAATVQGFDLFDSGIGQVRINDELGNQATINDQLYVILSVGDDREGGYQRDGSIGVPCDFFLGNDIENCDYTLAGAADAIFVAAPQNDQPGNRFYDDHIDFGIAGFLNEDSFWQWGGAGGAGRDVSLGDARLIVDMAAPGGAGTVSTYTGASSAPDAVVVNSGGAMVDNDLVVGTVSGGVRTIGDVVVGRSSSAAAEVVAPAFCYRDSLTGGTAGSLCP